MRRSSSRAQPPGGSQPDAFVDGVHFDRAFAPPAAIGHRALAANLSDSLRWARRPAGAPVDGAPESLPIGDFDGIIESLVAPTMPPSSRGQPHADWRRYHRHHDHRHGQTPSGLTCAGARPGDDFVSGTVIRNGRAGDVAPMDSPRG
jgi:hypothetical protein